MSDMQDILLTAKSVRKWRDMEINFSQKQVSVPGFHSMETILQTISSYLTSESSHLSTLELHFSTVCLCEYIFRVVVELKRNLAAGTSSLRLGAEYSWVRGSMVQL